MLTDKTLASNDPIPTSNAVLQAGNEYGGAFPLLPSSNAAFGVSQQNIMNALPLPRFTNTKLQDLENTRLYSFNEFNKKQSIQNSAPNYMG